MPEIIFASLFLSALALLLGTLKKADAKPDPTEWKHWLTALSLLCAYVVLMVVLGFYIATALFIPAMMFIFGIRKGFWLISIPLGFDLLIYLIFSRFLGILVPAPFFL